MRRQEYADNQLFRRKLSPARVQPDERLLLFYDEHDHIVVGCDYYLIGVPGMFENYLIR